MKRILFSILTLALLLPSRVPAQTKPDFSGTWTMDVSRSESPTYQEFVGPVTLVIRQTASELSIETRRGDKVETAVYKLHPSQTLTPALAGAPDARAFWRGMNLVSEAHRNINNVTVTAREVRSLNSSAAEMVVETIMEVQHGYTLSGTKNYGTAKDVFTRASR